MPCTTAVSSTGSVLLQHIAHPIRRCAPFKPCSRQAMRVVAMSKGFSPDAKPAKQQEQPEAEQQAAAAPAQPLSTIDILEARAKSGKRRSRVEPKVKVSSALVDQATGKSAPTPQAQAETGYVSALLFLFLAILVEGLLLAGAGFLPEEWDAFIQDNIYPSFSPTVLAFLGGSSLYGLWKTGKLPGQQQQTLK